MYLDIIGTNKNFWSNYFIQLLYMVETAPISLDLRIHSGSETPLGQALRAFRVYKRQIQCQNLYRLIVHNVVYKSKDVFLSLTNLLRVCIREFFLCSS